MHFDLRDLTLFVAVAEEGSLSRGAKKCFRSAGTASDRIRELEEQLDTLLFYRDAKGVILTPSGELLLSHARVILRQVERVKSEFGSQASEGTGHIRIFANTTAVTEFMPELLAKFLAERPRVTIDLQERLTRDIVRGVRDMTADFGIVAGPIDADDLEVIHFSTDRLVLVTPVRHPLEEAETVTFMDTLRWEHVALHEGSTLHAFLSDILHRHGKNFSARVQMRSFEAMCRMIEAGVGIGVLPQSAAIRHSKTMRLATIALSDAWAIRERSIIARQIDVLPRCAKALIAEICALDQPHGSREV